MSLVANPPVTPEFKKLLERAIHLKSREQYDEAAQLLEKLRGLNPRSASVQGILGHVFWEQDKLLDAISSFQKAVELSPESELASLGLFHTLWEAGKKQRAVTEMRRFMSHNKSKEYTKIASNLELQEIKNNSRTPADAVLETSQDGSGISIQGYFRPIFQENPELLKERSNESLYQMWLNDHPGESVVPEKVKQSLSNLKSILRKKLSTKRGRPQMEDRLAPKKAGKAKAVGGYCMRMEAAPALVCAFAAWE